MHPIASAYALRKNFKQICEEYGLEESLDGRTAWVDVAKRMCMDIMEHVRLGHLKLSQDTATGKWMVTGRDDRSIVLCFSFDAANFHRGMKQTSFGYKIANLMNCPINSPHVFHEFCLMEGADNHESIKAHVGHIIKQIDQVFTMGKIPGFHHPRIGDSEISIEFDPADVVACCDQVAGRSNFGQGGCNLIKPCFCCDVAKTQLCSTDPTTINDFKPRDLHTCNLLAHVALGVCPACELQIVDNITEPSTQILRAQAGDKDPPVPLAFEGVSWSELHNCQNYGQEVLFNIPIKQWCVCILHMNLRITGMMFTRTILRNLLSDAKSMNKNDRGDSKAADLHNLMSSLGIPCKIFSCPLNSVGKFYNSIAKFSFAGSDAARMLGGYDLALKIVFDQCVWDTQHKDYSSTSPDTERYLKALKMWKCWADDVWPLINDLDMDKEEKACAVERRGRHFIDLWVAAAGKHTSHLYPHLLVVHLPSNIRNLPVDPWYLQTESLEHKHKFRKDLSFMTNKHKPKPLAERITTTAGYYRHGKWIKGKVGKKTGECRSFQILAKSLVVDHLRGKLLTAAATAYKWERDKKSRERRNQKKFMDVAAFHATAHKTLDCIITRRAGDEEAARALAAAVDADDMSASTTDSDDAVVELDVSSDDDLELASL
jgi:hypothetical protein